ncbi:MAG: phosphoribosyltransferase-like protein [Betaproteobacteria bacterium]
MSWRANFRNDAERYFAACVLDSLIFRSDDQTYSLIQHLFQRTLPDLAEDQNLSVLRGQGWLHALGSTTTDPGIRLVAVSKRTDPPGKSPHTVIRMMRRNFGVNRDWTITPWNLAASGLSSSTFLIFVDDFLGTGAQFDEVVKAENLESMIKKHPSIYAPLAGFSGGVAELRRIYPTLLVQPVEVLTDEHRLFHEDSKCFNDRTNSIASAEAFYYSILQSRGIQLIGDQRRGYGGLELAYTFAHAAPDNCLPILWWTESPQWTPLLAR